MDSAKPLGLLQGHQTAAAIATFAVPFLPARVACRWPGFRKATRAGPCAARLTGGFRHESPCPVLSTIDVTAGTAGTAFGVEEVRRQGYRCRRRFRPRARGNPPPVNVATPTVSVSDAGGIFNGKPFPATATVAGVDGKPAASLEGVSLILTYYPADGTPLPGAPSAVGTYKVVANFPGNIGYASASAMTTFVINETLSPPTPPLPTKTLQPISALTGEVIEQKAIQVAANYRARGVIYKLGADASHGGKKSDCTHFVRDVLQQAGLGNPLIPYTTTLQFPTSMYFQLVPDNQARAGDVMVQGAHAGIFIGIFDKKGRPLGAEMGNHGAATFAPWGHGGWFQNPKTLKYYRPMQLV
jgi:hypothetical protein